MRRGTAAVACLAILTSCTAGSAPEPDPAPEPEPPAAPTPAGVRVGVVLPPMSEAASAELDRHARDLAALAADRAGEIASLRTVVPDASVFAGDLAAKLSDEGYDLVCILGDGGLRTVVDLAARYPASRFCAIGPPADNHPANVLAFDLAHEQLGHVLGAVAAELAGDGQVALVRADDRRDRRRRHAGVLAALAASDVVLDVTLTDDEDDGDTTLAALRAADPAVLVLDGVGDLARDLLLAGPPLVLLPADVAGSDPPDPPVLTWVVRADAVVAAALARWLAAEEVPDVLGFGEGAFEVDLVAGVPVAVADLVDQLRDDLVEGGRDPLEPVPAPEPDDDDADEDADEDA